MESLGGREGSLIGRARADAVLGALVVCIVAMMVVPLPTALLDVLIASNLALSVLLILVALSVRDGLAFSALPTLLLITTLYRLALNVSSTRLILLQADAGRIIAAFGDFVVRSDYAVGAAVFLVITIVQYVVVARGAERVAEVGARFSLDALPGKQMAIDADVRAGVLSPAAARARRDELERESRFYGAMDGAMKFVKGDAIAGIAIAFISFFAGTALGALRHGLSLGESAKLYGLLTVGDGLVSQIPSLLVATSAGVVVTRVASNEEGGTPSGDLARQLFGNARVLFTCAALFLTLTLIPGLPGAPFATLAFVLLLIGLTRGGATAQLEAARSRHAVRAVLGPQAASAVRASKAAPSTRLLERLGLSPARDTLPSALAAVLDHARARTGLPALTLALEEDAALPSRGYRLYAGDALVEHGELALLDQGVSEALAERIERAVQRHTRHLLGLDETQALLDALGRDAPLLVQHVVPQTLSLRALQRVLQGLAAERVCLQPLRPILEAIASEGASAAAPAQLIERVRARLASAISAAHARQGLLATHAIDPRIEDALRDAVQGNGDAAYLALPPDLARDIIARVRETIGADADGAVLVTQPDVRRWLRTLLEAELPEVAVLSYAELAPDARVEQRAAVRV
jgi:type III secretion protein V